MILLEATDATFAAVSAGSLVFGNQFGLSGAFARNGLFSQTRSFTQDTRIVASDLDVLATAAPVLLAFADGPSSTRGTKSDAINIAEAAIGPRTDGFLGGDVLVEGTATLDGVANAGAGSHGRDSALAFTIDVDAR